MVTTSSFFLYARQYLNAFCMAPTLTPNARVSGSLMPERPDQVDTFTEKMLEAEGKNLHRETT